MKFKIAVLPGDGIGPEVIVESIKVLDSIAEKYNHSFEYKEALVGACAIDKTGNPLPEETLSICKNSDAILFGAIGDPKYDNDPSAKIRPEQGLLKLRKSLGLYANIRPLTSYNSLIGESPLKEEIIKDTNFVIYRELTGGLYFGEKKISEDGLSAFDACSYTSVEVDRIAHLAFKAAEGRNKKLTLVDKANVLETSRLWRKRVTLLSAQYPEVEVNYLFVDNAAMQIILNPSQFDVILTENLFGDILSDEASVISGSIGLLASASVGDSLSLYEPIHGSYPQATGLDIANPIASILSVAMLLENFGLNQEADNVRQAVERSIELQITTPDLKGKINFSTSTVGSFISEYILDENYNFHSEDNVEIGQSTII